MIYIQLVFYSDKEKKGNGVGSQKDRKLILVQSLTSGKGSWGSERIWKHNIHSGGCVLLQWAWVLDVIGHGTYTFTLWPVVLQSAAALVSVIAHTHTHTHTQKVERPDRLWVCDVKGEQGVPGLAFTTEQGSVFVQGSHITCILAHCV